MSRQKTLTPRMQAFVKAYLECGVISKAAAIAGYSANGAAQAGSNLMKHPLVKRAIGEASDRALEKAEISVEMVLQELRDCLEACKKAGDRTNSLRSIEMIGKHLRMWSDKEQQPAATVIQVVTGIPRGENPQPEPIPVTALPESDAIEIVPELPEPPSE